MLAQDLESVNAYRERAVALDVSIIKRQEGDIPCCDLAINRLHEATGLALGDEP